MTTHATVEMFLDTSCPWCHGALETNRILLDEFAREAALPRIDLVWRFLRLHELPGPSGMPLSDYFASLGSTVDAAERDVLDYVHSVGVDVDFTRFTTMAEPRPAHALLSVSRDELMDGADDIVSLWTLTRAVMDARFVHGVDVSDLSQLQNHLQTHTSIRLPERVWVAAASQRGAALVDDDRARATQVQLDGVPRMYINGQIVPTWRARDEVRLRLREALSVD